MKAHSTPRFSEIELVLEPSHRELVRSFVREAALAEDVPAAVASEIADDSAQAWLALCASGPCSERVRIALLCSHKDVATRIRLRGHAQFSNIAASLAGCFRRDAGVSCREHGIDGWEVGLHRSLTGNGELPASAAEAPAPAATAAMPAQGCVIDLVRKSDTPAIARCFLQVYGHHYVHAKCSRRAATGTRSRAAN